MSSTTNQGAGAVRPSVRSLHTIAREIRDNWKKPYFGAVPYIDAMFQLDSIKDNYGWDSAEDIIIRFLGNATTWKGEAARRIKAELKEMIK